MLYYTHIIMFRKVSHLSYTLTGHCLWSSKRLVVMEAGHASYHGMEPALHNQCPLSYSLVFSGGTLGTMKHKILTCCSTTIMAH